MRERMSQDQWSLCVENPHVLHTLGLFRIQKPSTDERRKFRTGSPLYISRQGFHNGETVETANYRTNSYYHVGVDEFTHVNGVLKDGLREVNVPTDLEIRKMILYWTRVHPR